MQKCVSLMEMYDNQQISVRMIGSGVVLQHRFPPGAESA